MKKFLVVFLLIFSIGRGDILFLGDSMIEAIKPSAFKICKEEGKRCIFLYKRGLRTEKWLKGKYKRRLENVLSYNKIDKVVISTGTNDIVVGENSKRIYEEILSIISLIRLYKKKAKITVVAPPVPWDKGLNVYLYEHLKLYKIHVIKSKYYNLRLYDNVHPTPKESKRWMKKIWEML